MEKVIKDTESLFKTREKEYQETIDQIEVRASASRALPWPHEPRCRCYWPEPELPSVDRRKRDPLRVVVAVADP